MGPCVGGGGCAVKRRTQPGRLDGNGIGRCMRRHRHQEFTGFLEAIEADVPAGKTIEVILDITPSNKRPTVRGGNRVVRRRKADLDDIIAAVK